MELSYLVIWLSLLFVVLTLFPVAVWLFMKASRESDAAAGSNEAPYQKLNTHQILGKIAKR
jgi:hypothetical protein